MVFKRMALFAAIMVTTFVVSYEIAVRLFGHHDVILMMIAVASAVLASVVNDKIWSKS
ncbi:MAG TPA: hypothetical protein VH743_04610 [Beijerinckiaceae bacterium]